MAERSPFPCMAAAIVLFAAGMVNDGVAAPIAEEKLFAGYIPGRGDFAWENDLAAFRVYGPPLKDGVEDSGIDCWLKRVPYPIIEKWYRLDAEGKPYREDRGEGCDPYHVGSSRGCGGLALWKEGKMILSDVFTGWEIVQKTPEKIVFKLRYSYDVGSQRIDETKTITIESGRRMFHVNAAFSVQGRPLSGLEVAIGLTTHNGKAQALVDPAKGWMACWEFLDGYGFGTGVVLNPDRVLEMREVSGEARDTSHVLCLVRTDSEGHVSYWAGYGWSRGGEIKTLDDWKNYLGKIHE